MCCFYIRQKKKKFINVGLSNILDSELREVVGAAVVDSELLLEIFKLVSFLSSDKHLLLLWLLHISPHTS